MQLHHCSTRKMALCLLLCTISFLSHFQHPEASPSRPPDCQRKCGDTEIPYPFGITQGCYLDELFRVTCNETTGTVTIPVGMIWDIDSISITTHTFRHTNFPGIIMPFNRTAEPYVYYSPWFLTTRFRISHARNSFIAMGCDFFVYLVDEETGKVQGSCSSLCNNNETIQLLDPSACSGLNCCQIKYGVDLRNMSVRFQTMGSWAPKAIKHCGLFTFVENDFLRRNELEFASCNQSTRAPVIHEWSVGNTTCDEAIRSGNGYLCGDNTECTDHDIRRYRCRCRNGYRGNPYLRHGCQDFDECANSEDNNCPTQYRCVNTPGTYYCLPPRSNLSAVLIPLGTSLVVLCLVFTGIWTWHKFKRINENSMKQRFFKKNGGLLLQKRISLNEGNMMLELNLFKIQELEKATDRFNKSRILGRGGLGTVYKGMLSDGRIVAVKKAHTIGEKLIKQFINEVFILSQINHRHIVKLLGCCLESEAPLLVYEYISNGTLSQHLQVGPDSSVFSWEDRLRIAAEIAGALAYLHSYASTAIFHRDIKSNNILLDEKYRAVVSDFGLSRSVPIDKTHLTTIVGGTFGYLDPQYFRSGQLNDKSDVYAFGVVLAEILTGQRPVSLTTEEAGLACRFRLALKSDCLSEILEKELVRDGEKDEIVIVAKLAKRCLKLNAKKRPNMIEVAAKLDGLRRKSSDGEISCNEGSFSDKDCGLASEVSFQVEGFSEETTEDERNTLFSFRKACDSSQTFSF